MEVGITAISIFGLVFLIWAISTYNRLVRFRTHLRESWSNVDVALKRRHDLIPNLVETAKGFAAHESRLLTQVVRAREEALRQTASLAERRAHEADLVSAVNQLIARIEAYPELRSSEHFLKVQEELVNAEDRIAASRRFFNANVREYNAAVESFPSSIMAKWMSARLEEYFEIDALTMLQSPQTSFKRS